MPEGLHGDGRGGLREGPAAPFSTKPESVASLLARYAEEERLCDELLGQQDLLRFHVRASLQHARIRQADLPARETALLDRLEALERDGRVSGEKHSERFERGRAVMLAKLLDAGIRGASLSRTALFGHTIPEPVIDMVERLEQRVTSSQETMHRLDQAIGDAEPRTAEECVAKMRYLAEQLQIQCEDDIRGVALKIRDCLDALCAMPTQATDPAGPAARRTKSARPPRRAVKPT